MGRLGASGRAQLISQIARSGDVRTAQALAPAIQKLLRDTGWPPRSVELVAVAVGPGSFTGLRIGVTTAKTFAYAVGAEVLGVNTLDVLAAQAPPSPSPLWTVLDAQRQELFAAKFVIDNAGRLRTEHETAIVSQERWLREVRPGERVIGPALSRLQDRLPPMIEIVAPQLWQPMAEAVGSVAWLAYQAGRRDDLWKLAPMYYRPSAAEEKATLK